MDEFEARLKRRLQEGIDRLKEETERDQQFKTGWNEARRQIVLPILKKAGEVMASHQEFGHGQADYDNGGVLLEVFFSPQREADYWLSFSPQPESRKVVRFFGGGIEEEEPYDLEKLDREAVEQIVEDFIRAIHKHRIGTRGR